MIPLVDDEALREAVEACRAVFIARTSLGEAMARRDAAIVAFRRAHPEIGKRQVGRALRDGLVEAGFTPDAIAAAGVSDGTVIAALRGVF